MKRWEFNVVSYAERGDRGKCPDCGSSNVDVQIHRFRKRESITFTCLDCRSQDHFDGPAPEETTN